MFRLFLLLLFFPMAIYAQGPVEVDLGRTVDVEVWDGKKNLTDFILHHCCSDWRKWGSNKILILGKTTDAVYAVTSSSVMDGSDEECEIELIRAEFNGTITKSMLFKCEPGLGFDSVQWKSIVIENLKSADETYSFTQLKNTVVEMNEKQMYWVVRVNDPDKNFSVSWDFITDTEKGHDYYFSWETKTAAFIPLKDMKVYSLYVPVPIETIRKINDKGICLVYNKDSVMFKMPDKAEIPVPEEWIPTEHFINNRDSLISSLNHRIIKEINSQKTKFPILKTHQCFVVPLSAFHSVLVLKPYNTGTYLGILKDGDSFILAELFLDSDKTMKDWLKWFMEISLY